MDVITPDPEELTRNDGRPFWDITSHVVARLPGHESLFFVLGARHCPGCETLDRQMEAHSTALGETTALLHGIGGSFLGDDYVKDVVIGRMSLFTPGIPFGILFGIGRDGQTTRLDFRAILLGAFPESDPPAAMRALREGTSQVVDEAQGVTIRACIGPVCIALNASNRFHVPFSVKSRGDHS